MSLSIKVPERSGTPERGALLRKDFAAVGFGALRIVCGSAIDPMPLASKTRRVPSPWARKVPEGLKVIEEATSAPVVLNVLVQRRRPEGLSLETPM
jgi:hypothetical protein